MDEVEPSDFSPANAFLPQAPRALCNAIRLAMEWPQNLLSPVLAPSREIPFAKSVGGRLPPGRL
jgi:hypothetical protein